MSGYAEKIRWLEDMYPGYFTLTMATGIVAIGLELLGIKGLSNLIYWVTLISWGAIFVLYICRLIYFPKAVFDDLMDPRRTFSFFSFVAATNVSGMLLHMHGHIYLASLCWIVAFLAWSALLYCSFGVLILLHGERNVNIVDGGWLICIVGTQSLVLLGIKIVPYFGNYAGFMMLGIYMLWLLGLILYGIFVTLFCYRIFFLEMKIDDFSPLMWVVMGAAAISANSSSTLDMSDPVIHVLTEMHPVVDGMALLTWTWATWWIPVLVVIGFWKHFVRRIPLSYEPRQWSIVFPLGMYTVASYQLSIAAEFEPLHWISHGMIWVAIAVWCLLMIGLFRHLRVWFFITESPQV